MERGFRPLGFFQVSEMNALHIPQPVVAEWGDFREGVCDCVSCQMTQKSDNRLVRHKAEGVGAFQQFRMMAYTVSEGESDACFPVLPLSRGAFPPAMPRDFASICLRSFTAPSNAVGIRSAM